MELIQPLFDIVKCIWVASTKRINYARNLKKNFTELSLKARELFARRDDIKAEIDRVKLQKNPTSECEVWLAQVEEIENQMKMIEEEYIVENKCFKGWCLCPDVFVCMNLGERAEDMIKRIMTLEKSKFEGGFVTNLPLAIAEPMPVSTLKAEASVDRTLQKILKSTRDERIKKIGIWGMGGVGKTTIMKSLNNMPELTKMFDIVIWVTVSKSWSIRKLQNEVAQRLSVDITNEESDDSVARKLSRQLNGKKHLLLLDDVWERVDLTQVGMPNIDRAKGCKVVLTTRELGVCRKMGTDDEIKMEVLSTDEEWEMFCSIVGEVAISPDIQPLARDISRECGGLPLALNIVGGTLRKEKDVHVWRHLLQKLQSPATSTVRDMNEHVFKPLKVSYDQLEDAHKKLFLYCGLYPEDHEIEKTELIDYWRADGLLSASSKGTLAEACDEGHAILKTLTDASLLERCERDEHVKMHDVVRDLVLRMTSPGGEEDIYLVRAGLSNKEKIPEDEEWENASRISFMHNSRLKSLPERPNCPKLSTLLLRWNDNQLGEIPDSFFIHMTSLRVLDLSRTDVKYLPSSISNLVSLRMLLLEYCKSLEALPEEVSELASLEVLRVTYTRMRYLPSKFGKLTSLKCVKFSFDYRVEGGRMMIPSGTISGFNRLEDLIIEETEDCLSDESVNAVTKDLGTLTRLSSLTFNFRRQNNLQHFIQNNKSWRDQSLTKFHFSVSQYRYPGFRGRKRGLIYGGGDCRIITPAMIDVLSRSDFFALHHQGLNKLSDLGVGEMYGLKSCIVDECDEIEIIVDGDGLEVNAFPNLENLELNSLGKLRSIWEGPMQLGRSFTSLRTLALVICPRFKKLFSRGLIQQLRNLEFVRIRYCHEFEEMISEEDEMPELYGALPKLRTLELRGLPKFVSCFEGVSLCWPSLENVLVIDCPKLRKLPLCIDNAANLKKIIGQREWWEALEWEDVAIKQRMDPLFQLFR